MMGKFDWKSANPCIIAWTEKKSFTEFLTWNKYDVQDNYEKCRHMGWLETAENFSNFNHIKTDYGTNMYITIYFIFNCT